MRRLGYYRVAPASTLVLLLFLVKQSFCSGVFEIRLSSFVNDQAKDFEGKCCGGARVTSSGPCPGQCRTSFRVCLTHYQENVVVPEPTACTFGNIFTPVIGNNTINRFNLDKINVTGLTNPLRFPFSFSWPGTFSLVLEAWHEPNSSGQEKVLITRLITKRHLAIGLQWANGTEQDRVNNATLAYSFRVHCDANYYGDNCGNFCRPRNDSFGHFRCTANGTMECLPGWTGGNYCTKAVCAPGCHEQHGTCDAPNECKCRIGWQGKLCDQCVRYPGCVKGTCNNPWQCNCDEGWGGLFCNQDLNYCTNHKPCKNGGTCTNTGQGLFTCECPEGYGGPTCATKMDDCAHKPCLNGGKCEGEGSNYTCICPLGFHGVHCETTVATCSEMQCHNGGTCVDGSGGARCKCAPGYDGANCKLEKNDCSPNPCFNGGTCEDQLNGFRCSCPKGFSGIRCEDNINDCAQNPCLNGGTCMDMVNGYKCACVPGFIGPLCSSNFNECLTMPCSNGGTCHDLVNGFSCTCQPGFTGPSCLARINECDSSPCMNGATCEDSYVEFRCHCAHGFSGKRCDQRPDGGVAVAPVQDTSGAANDSRAISDPGHYSAEDNAEEGLPAEQVVLIATFSALVPLLALVSVLVILCLRRKRQKAAREEEMMSNNGRAVVESAEDEEIRRQNEQNAGVHSMNNKCLESGGQIIVNALDKKPLSGKGCYNKMTNEDKMVDKLHSLSTLQRTKLLNADINSKLQLEKDCDKQQQIVNKRTSLTIDVACTSPSETMVLKSADKDYAASVSNSSCRSSPVPISPNSVYVIEEHSEAPQEQCHHQQRYPSDRRLATEV